MPHCIIEISKELNKIIGPSTLIETTHQAIVSSGLFEESHIKTRIQAYEHYKTGTSPLSFIHVTVRILSGRNLDQKANLSKKVLNQLKTLIETQGLSSISLTIEICDIEREAYSKVIL